MAAGKQRQTRKAGLRSFVGALGPGLITGAADDDPSGIGTHSQIGAEFGYGLAWTFVLSFPLMVVIQEVAADIGRITGVGIARNLKRHYRSMLWPMVALLLVANVVNLGADLSAMGAAMALLIGGNGGLYTLLFGILCIGLEVGLSYPRYASVLKWTTLSLFTYVGVVLVAHVPWLHALRSLVVPELQWNAAYATALVAILGTTISPYLFFWQAGQEIEEQRRHHIKPLCITPRRAGPELKRIRLDTLTGMAFSTIVSLAIVFATAATLHENGIRDIATSQQAAEALRPIAGKFAFAMFAIGIIGTGLLAVPVLAGSAAYAITEVFHMRGSLELPASRAIGFYAIVAAATIGGSALLATNIDPIAMLFWTAVINGIVAVPIMIAMMLVVTNKREAARVALPRWIKILGWLGSGLMAIAVVLMIWSSVA